MNSLITVEGHVSMGHRLPSYKGICSSLHGHNVRFVATVRAKEFLDFKQLHVALQSVVHDFDHALVLYDGDPWAGFFVNHSEVAEKQRLVLLNVEPSTEAIATYVFMELCKHGYDVEKVTVHETDKYSASCTEYSEEVQRVD